MSSKIVLRLVFFLFVLLSFTACQQEETEVVNPNEQEALVSNSSLVNLMSRTTAHFGASDDILDGASCFSVELPVTITVSGIVIVIETEADLEQLEDLMDDFNDVEEALDFIFPITIILADYTEIIIENETQLENFITACEEEDVIECVDFVYPISFSVFNLDFNLVNTVSIAHDEALYQFLEALEEDDNALIVSINYPVFLVVANGELIEINSNAELAEAIASASDNCDNDEAVFNCFDDFEIVVCESPNIIPVYNLSANTIGLLDCPEPFTPSFHATLMDAENNTNLIENTENFETLTTQVYLRIETESGNFEIFNIYLSTEACNLFECFQSFDATIEICDNGTDGPNTYNLQLVFENCEAEVMTFHTTALDAEGAINPIVNPSVYETADVQSTIYARIEIENQFEVFPILLSVTDCENNICSEADIITFLLECIWNPVNYNGSDNLMEWHLDFENSNQIVVIYTETQTIDASWSTSESNEGAILEFSNVSGPNIQVITGAWLVIECTTDRLELHRGEDILVLERNCNT